MTLQFVKPSASPTMNALLYGGPKTGKTVGAASAPGPLLYLNADLPNATRFAHQRNGDKISEAFVEDLDTLAQATRAAQAGDFATVVLDPVGEVHRRVIEGLSGRAVRPGRNQYGDTTVHVERFCRALCELPVNFVIVAHETAVKDEGEGVHERLPWTGTTNPALGAKLMQMVDVIGYCGVKVEGDGEAQTVSYMAQTVNGGGRRGGARAPFDAVLGTGRELDLSAWIAEAAAVEAKNTDKPEEAKAA